MSEELPICPKADCQVTVNHGHGGDQWYRGKENITRGTNARWVPPKKTVPETVDYSSDGSRSFLKNLFTYHAPFGTQVGRYENIREAGLNLALVIDELAPGSPERTKALEAIREAIFWANAAIACNETESGHVHGHDDDFLGGGEQKEDHPHVDVPETGLLNVEETKEVIKNFEARAICTCSNPPTTHTISYHRQDWS